VFESTGIEYTL